MIRLLGTSLALALLVITTNGHSECLASAINVPQPGDAWLVTFPPPPPSDSMSRPAPEICKIIFVAGYVWRVTCYDQANSSRDITKNSMQDYATARSSPGWPASIDPQCTLRASIPMVKAGPVQITASMNGNTMSGTYTSNGHPAGVAFEGIRISPNP